VLLVALYAVAAQMHAARPPPAWGKRRAALLSLSLSLSLSLTHVSAFAHRPPLMHVEALPPRQPPLPNFFGPLRDVPESPAATRRAAVRGAGVVSPHREPAEAARGGPHTAAILSRAMAAPCAVPPRLDGQPCCLALPAHARAHTRTHQRVHCHYRYTSALAAAQSRTGPSSPARRKWRRIAQGLAAARAAPKTGWGHACW
jgi:hypothetical protein